MNTRKSRASVQKIRLPVTPPPSSRSNTSTPSPTSSTASSSSSPMHGTSSSRRAISLDLFAERAHARFRRAQRERRTPSSTKRAISSSSPSTSISSSPAAMAPLPLPPSLLPSSSVKFPPELAYLGDPCSALTVYDEDIPQALSTTIHEYATDEGFMDAMSYQADRELTLNLLWSVDQGPGESMCAEWLDRK
ncbi:hypothetical protein HGRIS_014609 [Hohenbuehelia grisea]|uniref:Uncharacterized protein n=1 Tax=Hohenbuehelia grisea TaxID=104357 RepID=A0ABR3JU91_9AGAR